MTETGTSKTAEELLRLPDNGKRYSDALAPVVLGSRVVPGED